VDTVLVVADLFTYGSILGTAFLKNIGTYIMSFLCNNVSNLIDQGSETRVDTQKKPGVFFG